MQKSQSKLREILLSAPTMLWLTVFFLLPLLVLISLAFRSANIYGGIESSWTLENVEALLRPYYFYLIFRSLWASFLTTIICLFIALPTAYFLANVSARFQKLLLFAVIVPLWTSFVIRVFAWKSLLHPESMLKKVLVALQICDESTMLLYQFTTVIFVMVYSYLPVAILPIFSSASRFDYSLIEAACDLGLSPFRAFIRVFLPGISQGIRSAILMVFIPSLGVYVIPEVVGGHKNELIGNKIVQRIFIDRNIPEACALALLLALITAFIWFVISFAKKSNILLNSKKYQISGA